MKKILAFGASNSSTSINKQFAQFASGQLTDVEVTLLDLNDFEMPIYSIDREKESGIPPEAVAFKNHIKAADGILISFAEYNSSYTSAFKNIYDWVSRYEKDVWEQKPMFLMSTSPGKRGGKTVLAAALARYEQKNENTMVTFSLPSFYENFSKAEGITDETLLADFRKQLVVFAGSL
ncbi:MAG: NAD(P)H-dependent oxidoreductase [Bacteroidota bacterium]